MSSQQLARLLMEALAVLHQQGYGLFKLSCYVKDGIGAWRHCIFASEEFPDNVGAWLGPKQGGSLPGWGIFSGSTPEEVADNILERYPRLAEAARGQDEVYVSWFQQMLADYPDGVLEMESPDRASIYGVGSIALPALKAWRKPPPTHEEIAAQRERSRLKELDGARQGYKAWEERQRQKAKR